MRIQCSFLRRTFLLIHSVDDVPVRMSSCVRVAHLMQIKTKQSLLGEICPDERTRTTAKRTRCIGWAKSRETDLFCFLMERRLRDPSGFSSPVFCEKTRVKIEKRRTCPSTIMIVSQPPLIATAARLCWLGSLGNRACPQQGKRGSGHQIPVGLEA